LFNAPAKLSANWFGENERVYSTSIGFNSNFLGIGIGVLIPSLFIEEGDVLNSEQA
jgi:hypothetical protein